MSAEYIYRAKQLILEYGISAEILYHSKSGAKTEQASEVLGIDGSYILKTLILYAVKDQSYLGFIILGNTRLDFGKIESILGIKKIRFAKNNEIFSLTGFHMGGVPPMAVKLCRFFYVDKNVIAKQFVIGAGGNEHIGLKFCPKELINKLGIPIAEVTV